jgi:hypothetical protein
VSKIYLVVRHEVDADYFNSDGCDVNAQVEIVEPVRCFIHRAHAEKYVKDNEAHGVYYKIYDMNVRETYD